MAVPYAIAADLLLRAERGRPSVLREAHWAAHALLSLGVGAIAFALSEEERHFWLEAWRASAGLLGELVMAGVAVSEMRRRPRPLLAMVGFRRPTFCIAILLSLLFRCGSLFAIFIMPQYLGRVQGLRPADHGALLCVMIPAAGLGREVRGRWSDVAVVLTSGYSHVLADDARHGFALHKPYSVDELSRVLRAARRPR